MELKYSSIEIGDQVIIEPRILGYGKVKMQTTIIKSNGDIYQECKICGRYILDDKRRITHYNIICPICNNY